MPRQLREHAGSRLSMQECHWLHVHDINKDANKAGVYHNHVFRLIYEDVRIHAAKICSAFSKKLNECV